MPDQPQIPDFDPRNLPRSARYAYETGIQVGIERERERVRAAIEPWLLPLRSAVSAAVFEDDRAALHALFDFLNGTGLDGSRKPDA